MQTLCIDGLRLTLEDVGRVADGGVRVTLDDDAVERVGRARALVDAEAASGRAVYGVNTGFGYLSQVRIDPGDLAALQLNLIRSHAVGVGEPLDDRQVRALMLLRANVLATGRSGVRAPTLRLLIDMLNRDLLPVVPGKGSVGASGDLAPLAHIALAMIGEGTVRVGGRIVASRTALAEAGLEPLAPAAKEGLCLINGTQAMGALGALAVLEAETVARIADVAGAASLEGHRGTVTAFDRRIHECRPHRGQVASAANLRRLLDESDIAASHVGCDRVQDAYSLRCMPQVHGSSRDVFAFARDTLTVEINAATDNPLVFAEPDEDAALLSGGNFHGQPVAMVLDFVAIAVSELANISDRRVEQLIDPALSGLPAFLTADPGLHSGFMMAQVTSASLVNENKVLAYPAVVDSIPTSAGREDHVSMGMTSARKALQVLSNARYCLAIELLCACQAIDLIGLAPGRGVGAAHRAIRRVIPKLDEDRVLHDDINAVEAMIRSGALLAEVENELGGLQ